MTITEESISNPNRNQEAKKQNIAAFALKKYHSINILESLQNLYIYITNYRDKFNRKGF